MKFNAHIDTIVIEILNTRFYTCNNHMIYVIMHGKQTQKLYEVSIHRLFKFLFLINQPRKFSNIQNLPVYNDFIEIMLRIIDKLLLRNSSWN